MNAINVELKHRDEERAGGLIRFPHGEPVVWTAICSEQGQWYVVLHGEMAGHGSTTLRVALDRIRECLREHAAAA